MSRLACLLVLNVASGAAAHALRQPVKSLCALAPHCSENTKPSLVHTGQSNQRTQTLAEPEIKKLPCQGFEGEPCRHKDTHTATGDWRSEYGPQPVRAGARASSAMVAVVVTAAALMFGA